MATIKGKWKWNDTWIYSKLFSVDVEMHFISNEEEFVSLRVESDVFWGDEPVMCYRLSYNKQNGDYINVAEFLETGEVTLDPQYNLLEIQEQEIDDELYAFILANATEYVPTLTMAEKLTKIAENQQKVYDAGYKAGEEAILNWFLPTTQGIKIELTESIDSDGSELGAVSSTTADILFGPRHEYNNVQQLVPVLYNIHSVAGRDRNTDKYYYIGKAIIDTIQYDKWRKIEPNGYNWESPVQVYVYTNQIID